MNRLFDFDDTDLAIIGLVILAGIAMFVIADPATVLTAAIAAIAGLATGRKRLGPPRV